MPLSVYVSMTAHLRWVLGQNGPLQKQAPKSVRFSIIITRWSTLTSYWDESQRMSTKYDYNCFCLEIQLILAVKQRSLCFVLFSRCYGRDRAIILHVSSAANIWHSYTAVYWHILPCTDVNCRVLAYTAVYWYILSCTDIDCEIPYYTDILSPCDNIFRQKHL